MPPRSNPTISSFRSLESCRSGVFNPDPFLDRRLVRRLLFGFDLPLFERVVERELLLRREDEAVLFLATNDPYQALFQGSVQNLCHPFTIKPFNVARSYQDGVIIAYALLIE